MMVRRTLEGAEKCALRAFLLEEWRPIDISMAEFVGRSSIHTGVDLGHFVGVSRVFVAEAKTLCCTDGLCERSKSFACARLN